MKQLLIPENVKTLIKDHYLEDIVTDYA